MILAAIKITLSSMGALAVLYFLAIMPRMIKRPDTSLFKKVYFAHRGLHDNTGTRRKILWRLSGGRWRPDLAWSSMCR